MMYVSQALELEHSLMFHLSSLDLVQSADAVQKEHASDRDRADDQISEYGL